MNILLVEDEQPVAAFIKKGLEEQQYVLTVVHDGTAGLSIALSQEFDIIILDLMLPGIGGMEICKTLRTAGLQTPIVMLTALSTVKEKVSGLESGADDYITKPFHFDELLARLKVLVRRQKNISPDRVYTAGDLVMNCYKRAVTLKGKEITLTVKEYTLLELLLANKNRVLSRSEIVKNVWGTNFDRGSNLVDVYINFLRTKIDKGAEKKLIQTVIGMGYVIKD